MHTGFQETESCEEYVDKLLEYGCVFLLEKHEMFSAENLEAIATCAGCASGALLVTKLQNLLDFDFLESWLEDRGHSPATLQALSVDKMFDLYREISLGCLFGQTCPDPNFPTVLVLRQAIPQAMEQQQPEAGELKQEEHEEHEQITEFEFAQALSLYTAHYSSENPADNKRNLRIAALLRVDPQCGQSPCDSNELGAKIATRLMQLLTQEKYLNRLNELVEAQQGNVVMALRALSRENRAKLDTLQSAQTLKDLFALRQNTEALWSKLVELKLARGAFPGTAQVQDYFVNLLDTYVPDKVFLRQLVSGQLQVPVASFATSRDLFFVLK